MTAVHLKKIEYSDEFARNISAGKKFTMDDVITASNDLAFPGWVRFLFRLRDAIVGWFGVKTMNEHVPSANDSFGLFPVLQRTDNEIIAGADDKHLNFRVVIRLVSTEGQLHRLSLLTLVQFNNIYGKIYFVPVKPFHKIIVPILLKRLVSRISATT
jgi:hypothetical protein